MKLIVTVGNANGEFEELVFDVPPPITYIGVEVEDISTDPDNRTGRATIMRMPFVTHGETRIHTICSRIDDTVQTVEM